MSLVPYEPGCVSQAYLTPSVSYLISLHRSLRHNDLPFATNNLSKIFIKIYLRVTLAENIKNYVRVFYDNFQRSCFQKRAKALFLLDLQLKKNHICKLEGECVWTLCLKLQTRTFELSWVRWPFYAQVQTIPEALPNSLRSFK